MRHLFHIFLRIGLLSFGGPAAQIALMQTELVDRHKIITQQKFLQALSLCMLLPGPEAMQLATYIGWQRAGVWGGLMAGALFVIPGAIFIGIMALIYVLFGSVPLVQGAFVGIQAVVVLIVIQALIRLWGKAFTSRAHIWIAVGAFIGLFAFQVPFPVIIIGALALGAALGGATTETPPAPVRLVSKPAMITALAWLAPLGAIIFLVPGFYADIAWFFSKLAMVTFGGAYAVLTYMTQTVVQDQAWITTDQMMDALGLAETTPGPLILVTQFVGMLAGYGIGGIGAAIIAGIITLWMTFVPCFLWIFAFGPHLDRITGHPRLAGALAGVTAAVVGVIANLSLWFGMHVFFGATQIIATGPMSLTVPILGSWQVLPILLAVVCAIPLFTKRLSLPPLIGLAAGIGAIAQTVAW